MKTAIISVLYNQRLPEGNTWNTLLLPALRSSTEGMEIQVILADNSSDGRIREENRREADGAGAVFLDMGGNKGLPAAYNRAVDAVLCSGGDSGEDWIVITDQDTCFPENYLQVLGGTAGQTDCGVLFASVRAGEKQLSPCCRKGSRFVPFSPQEEEEKPAGKDRQELFFINTGTAFRREVFADPAIRYNERLFLDFTDFDLICRIREKTQIRFGQLPGIELQQSFSGTEERTAEQDLERFRHFARDGRLFYEKWYGKNTADRAVRNRALRLAAKHRDLRFLKQIRT